MQRKGKIARLPLTLRAELNQRLAANQDGAALLDWLNASPEVQAVLARDFAGEPITKQNLYEWRQGGFVEAQTRQELLAQAASPTADAAEADAPASGHLIGNLVALLAVRYADLLARWDRGDNEALRVQLRVLHTFTRDLAALHRINQFAERQQKDQARSDRKARKTAATEATDQARNIARAFSNYDLVAKRQHQPVPVPRPDFGPAGAPYKDAADRHSGNAAAQCAADKSAARGTEASVLNQDLVKSCATKVQPMVPQPGFGSNEKLAMRPGPQPCSGSRAISTV